MGNSLKEQHTHTLPFCCPKSFRASVLALLSVWDVLLPLLIANFLSFVPIGIAPTQSSLTLLSVSVTCGLQLWTWNPST